MIDQRFAGSGVLGAEPVEGGVRFSVWASVARTVDVVIEHNTEWAVHRLDRAEGAIHSATVPDIGPGARYLFSIDGAPGLPDPRSRFQPEGVHGPSEVIDLGAFRWLDGSWEGLRNENLSIYEVHVGTYTPEGTFEALTQQLKVIRDLGVRAIELMPVADFPGRWNWGYDGVSLFAPSRAYGRPEALQRLVDTAHSHGLAVLIDVVYNHLGPDGNYLRQFSPEYFTDRHQTPWGEAINFDGPGARFVRDFVIENAIQWVRDYHVDGLRLDASDTIHDAGNPHILAELQRIVRAAVDRDIVIIAEEARNDVRTIRPVEKGGFGIDAVWADDFHHESRVILSNAWENYYGDFRGSMEDLAKSLNEGFIFQGQTSKHWGGPRGTTVTDEPASGFVIALQNHDQIGNRPFGERLHHDINLERYLVASMVLLLAPQTPLLFMGQEFLASTPFLYFTDHNEELGRLVTEGRRKEFGGFRAFASESSLGSIPDPQAEATFLASKLRLEERTRHCHVYDFYQKVLYLRNNDPVFAVQDRHASRAMPISGNAIALHRWRGNHHRLLIANFGNEIEELLELPGTLSADFNLNSMLSTQDPAFGGEGLAIAIEPDGTGARVTVPARTAVLFD